MSSTSEWSPVWGKGGIAYELGQAKEENALYHNVNIIIMNYAKNTCYSKNCFK